MLIPINTSKIVISIHALTKSATYFQTLFICSIQISIHALTKSATLFFILKLRIKCNFNPRTHKECDSKGHRITLTGEAISIHALTKSATFAGYGLLFRRYYFNPRTHKECDTIERYKVRIASLFQSTHSQRVRRAVYG